MADRVQLLVFALAGVGAVLLALSFFFRSSEDRMKARQETVYFSNAKVMAGLGTACLTVAAVAAAWVTLQE